MQYLGPAALPRLAVLALCLGPTDALVHLALPRLRGAARSAVRMVLEEDLRLPQSSPLAPAEALEETPEAIQPRAALWQQVAASPSAVLAAPAESEAMPEAPLPSRSLVNGVRSRWATYLSSESDRLWRAVFSECDSDDDGAIDRRELLVLLERLGAPIPSAQTVKDLFYRYDVDENGQMDFSEFCSLVRDMTSQMKRMDDATGALADGFAPGWTVEWDQPGATRRATRRWLKERRKIVLWRSVFDSLDAMPRDGFLDAAELRVAFERTGVLDLLQGVRGTVTAAQLMRQAAKYDANADGRLSFNEFSRFCTDVISSTVLYERALANATLTPYGEAAARAAEANRQIRERREERATRYAALALAQRRRRAGGGANSSATAAAAAEDEEEDEDDSEVAELAELAVSLELTDMAERVGGATFTEALSVLQTQDDLYRRFKLKYASRPEGDGAAGGGGGGG